MKKIRVKFVDKPIVGRYNCYGEVDKGENYIKEILRRRYILNEKSYPDYVFTYVPVGGGKGL